ncbi:MAG: TMEM175 family protein [Candidatus Eremiobacteraeota bacterium]|nr:TMEM175 family protein [Candidatus Eremiobacteraeota bacterium]
MERDEHLVHRLEAFCDIVVGFSLAELTFGLLIPGHAIALVTNLNWLIFYLVTFAIVALMWWSHYRLFRIIFYPDTLNILLNYAWLASVGLLVFFMQVTARATTSLDSLVATDLYFSTLAINFVLNSVMLMHSYRKRGGILDEPGRARVVRVTVATLLSALMLAVGVLWVSATTPTTAIYLPLAIFVGFGGSGALVAFWNRLRNRRKRAATEETR